MFINNFKHLFFYCVVSRFGCVVFFFVRLAFCSCWCSDIRAEMISQFGMHAKPNQLKRNKSNTRKIWNETFIYTHLYTPEKSMYNVHWEKKNQQQHSITGLVIQWVENYAQPLRFLICIGNSALRELWLCICVFCILNFFTTILTSYLILWIIYGFNWCMIRSLININIILIRYLILFSLRLLFLCWMYNNFAQFRSLNILLKPDELYIFQCV